MKIHKIVRTGSNHAVGALCTIRKAVSGIIVDLYLNLVSKLNIAHAQYRKDGGRLVMTSLIQLIQDKKNP